MKVLVTGSASGIGLAIANKFLSNGHEVIGMDIKPSMIKNDTYSHIMTDITSDNLPEITDLQVIINNAGVQNTGKDIDINLKGSINVTEKYAFQPRIKSVVFVASASASTGSEFPEYAASKGGIVAYMKNTALRLAKFGATSNSISPGGVMTELNRHIIDDARLWNAVMDVTPLKKWAEPCEIAEWVYFVAAVNKSMTAQDIIIDNGESSKADFVW